jgi:phage baseplate assembly protein W
MSKINRNIRLFTDFSFVFNKHPTSFDLVKKNNDDAVKQSLRNLILTKHYERPFHPEIGCQIHSLLFENWDPILERIMQQTIIDLVNKFEPRVRLIDVRINSKPDENSIEITLEYTIINSEKPITFTTALLRVR